MRGAKILSTGVYLGTRPAARTSIAHFVTIAVVLLLCSAAGNAGQLALERSHRKPGRAVSKPAKPPVTGTQFSVRNYGGKCLDYGSLPDGSSGGAAVFLNDCAVAHPIRVQEVDDKHDVILRAGASVIGIHNPLVNKLVGAAAAPAVGPEFALELQHYNPILATTRNQVFALDGDSMILATSRPCFNSIATTSQTLCAAPQPLIVIQVEKGRGTNGSPLVAGVRHLSDNEFWDFIAVDGSAQDPTKGFVRVATNSDLWNVLCMPQVARAAASFTNPPTIVDPGQADDGTPLSTNIPCTPKAGPGSVIEVTSGDPNECTFDTNIGACLDLGPFPPLTLTPGVTLRGGRRGTNFGPQLYYSYDTSRQRPDFHCESCMIEVMGDYVRVTGLRMRGQSRSVDSGPYTTAIQVGYPGPVSTQDGPTPFYITTMTQYIATVDHNDISDWGEAAVRMMSAYALTPDNSDYCTFTGFIDIQGDLMPYPCNAGTVPDFQSTSGKLVPIIDDPGTLANVTVARNFLHHNERDSGGYGALTTRGLVEGNTFLMNRHAITAGGEAHNEYRAQYNMVLSNAPLYTGFCFLFYCNNYHNQDFDMHGTGGAPHWYGGTGGFSVDISGNTFFGTNRQNYELRGKPSFNSEFHGNISLEDHDSAVYFKDSRYQVSYRDMYIDTPTTPYQFGHSDPTKSLGPASLGVGDFDHDGIDDLFLATGAAWYFSPGGAREWRFLNAMPDTMDQLLLGDFDGDGRTDVVAIKDGRFMVSWGGISAWEVLNQDPTDGRLLLLPSAVSAMAVGDFNGDGKSDIFWADGKTWWISYGGRRTFTKVNDSSFRVKDLRFGDFDGDGATDVFGVVSNGKINTWSYSKSATGQWADGFLRPALTNTVDGLYVADFTYPIGSGKKIVSVAMQCSDNSSGCWRMSVEGREVWSTFNRPDISGKQLAGVGHFLGRDPGQVSDVLWWNGTELSISTGGVGQLAPHSSQDMQ